VLALRWSEVDAPGRALRLRDTKEGASVRPIGAAALAVLAGLPRREDVDWVFPGRGSAPYGGLRTAWESVLKRSGLSGISPHTLRHSFASVAGDLGYSESTIAALLGHAAGSVTGRYTHHLDAVLIAAADRAAGQIAFYLKEQH
jgi:integrase